LKKVWRSKPHLINAFDDLINLPKVITGVIHARKPYGLGTMNIPSFNKRPSPTNWFERIDRIREYGRQNR